MYETVEEDMSIDESNLDAKEDKLSSIVSAASSHHSQFSVDQNENPGHSELTTQALSVIDKPPISKSCDDLFQDVPDDKRDFLRSQSCLSLNSNGSQNPGKYDHVQSKIKQYIGVLSKDSPKIEASAETAKASKELYLEEINLRLSRELDEKNAILNQLQQNYEHLLLKYAEAQNKIDNLRVQTLKSESHGECSDKPKSVRKQITSKPIYPCNIPPVDCQRPTFLNTGAPPRQESRIDRPSTLAVDGNLRVFEKEGLKAVTPTDSEGVSSVITSMSGHSKILNNFDDQPGEDSNDKSLALKSDVLEKSLQVSDPFDKVKNWQNSLPPLEFIETPDTALYDLNPITPSTMYNELPISELHNINETPGLKSKMASQAVMKKYLRTLSLPSSLTRRNLLSQIYKRRNNHTIDLTSPLVVDCITPQRVQPSPEATISNPRSPKPRESPPTRIIQRRRKKAPFLRSASLPAYDCESPRILQGNPVPPLDLDNLTLSEDETSPVNAITSESFLSTHDYSFQTLDSRNPCKATLSDFSGSSLSRSKEQLSTPVLPNRGSMSFSQVSETVEADDCCNVCGESVMSVKATSSQGMRPRPQDLSFIGSVSAHKSPSFNSELSSPSRCMHNEKGEDAPESFDTYASNLKARSDLIMKALTAHVKHS